MSSHLHGCLGAMLLPQSYQYPNLSREGADRVDEQLRGDKECPFDDDDDEVMLNVLMSVDILGTS